MNKYIDRVVISLERLALIHVLRETRRIDDALFVVTTEDVGKAAAYLGIPRGFDGFRSRIMDLRAELAIPANLSALGVDAARLDELTEMALEDPSCGGNPVTMTHENTRVLFEACL